MSGKREIVAIGASWGGLDALGKLLPALPAKFDFPVVIAQHRGERDVRTDALVHQLQQFCAARVQDCDDKQRLLPGNVYIAPAGYHFAVAKGCATLSCDEPVHFARPSIDVLFESVADAYRERALGIILTGASADGADGLRRLRERGGLAVVQDPATAEMPTLPRAALQLAAPQKVLDLEQIASLLRSMG